MSSVSSENEIDEESSFDNDNQLEGQGIISLKLFLDKLNGEKQDLDHDFEFKGLIDDDISNGNDAKLLINSEIWEKDHDEWFEILKKNQKNLTTISKKVIDLKKFLLSNGQDTKEVMNFIIYIIDLFLYFRDLVFWM
jgi:hypothetical protein